VRQVNVDDRELDVGSKDGFFSVIVANRLPSPGAKCRACLVSLEGRRDLVPKEPPDQTQGLASILEFDYTVDFLTPGTAIPHAPLPAAAPHAPLAAPPAAIPHRHAAASFP